MFRSASSRFLSPLLLATTFATASGAEWVGFRGPVPADLEETKLPLSWAPQEHVRWSAKFTGVGQSSPVVWGIQVYITTVEGPRKETCHVAAYHLKTGERLWQTSSENATPEEVSPMISKAAPTSVVDPQGVIALFEGGNLLALSHGGEKLWERNLVAEYGPILSRHGLSSSLAQTDENVIVWVEREKEPYILCLKKSSGDLVWKQPGLEATAWSSPVLLNVGGEQHLVFSASGKLRGVRPDTGDELWSLEGISGNTTPSPCVAGEGLLLIGATDSRGESGGGKAASSNCMVRIQKSEDGKYAADFVWRAKRATSSFGSPIIHQGLAYFVNRTGILFCLDAETGEEIYAERTPESCWATPLAVDNRIYLVGQKGTTTVVKAGRSFETLSKNRLWEDAPAKEEGPAGEAPRRESPNREGGERPSGAPGNDSANGRPSGPRVGGGGPGYGNDNQIQYAVAAVPGYLLIRTGDQLYCVGE